MWNMIKRKELRPWNLSFRSCWALKSLLMEYLILLFTWSRKKKERSFRRKVLKGMCLSRSILDWHSECKCEVRALVRQANVVKETVREFLLLKVLPCYFTNLFFFLKLCLSSEFSKHSKTNKAFFEMQTF